MMSSDFFSRFTQKAYELYPQLKAASRPLNPDHLVSPYVVPLETSAFSKISNFISVFYKASRQPLYRELIDPEDKEINAFHAPNAAVLMAYDFHIDSQGRPRLIEINTNASGFLIADLIYRAEPFKNVWPDALSKLRESFQEEAQSLDEKNLSCAIIDETLEQQKMLIEFFLYKELFEQWGWKATIDDFASLRKESNVLRRADGSNVDFIYNRYNDFYLNRPESRDLRAAYLGKEVILSPHPVEYLLLADKMRLIEWTRTEFQDRLGLTPAEKSLVNELLLKSYELKDFDDIEDLWRQRKKFFFKPLRSYGSKAAFKGANISRRMFEEIFSSDDCFAQELCPAPLWTSPEGESWKYDLRFYVYRDQIQLAVGRIYQGQVTNFKADASGFCRLLLN